MSFSTNLERRDAAAIVSMEGELDIATEAQATADLDRAMDGCELLVVDLRELSFLDSTGVRVLLAADLRARENGMRFGRRARGRHGRAPARGHADRSALPGRGRPGRADQRLG